VLALFRTLGSVSASGFISRTRAMLFLHNPFPSRQLALHRPCPLALFRTISLVRGDAWGTAALGGDPSRGRLGYMRCPFDRSRVSPYGHPTNGSRRPPLALFHTTGCPRAIASKLAGPCFWAGNADRSAWSPTTTSSRPLRDQCFRGQDGRFEFRCVRPGYPPIWKRLPYFKLQVSGCFCRPGLQFRLAADSKEYVWPRNLGGNLWFTHLTRLPKLLHWIVYG